MQPSTELKKTIGFNATEEEVRTFEKHREAAGFDSNADFIKARCLGKPDKTKPIPQLAELEHKSILLDIDFVDGKIGAIEYHAERRELQERIDVARSLQQGAKA